ncbi:SRPBCC family protein [Endozoicomonas montiporae]|uniref:SRPBCC family protein n=1 Tax=Endozoicomonas montiporae TaxID=1027273 RepID=UPI00068ADED5
MPDLTGCEMHEGPKQGIGTSRRVFLSNGSHMDETVTQWQELQGFTIRLHKGDQGAPKPFSEASFVYRIEPEGQTTRLTMTMDYTMKGGVIARLMDKAFMNLIIRSTVARIAKNMKGYYETGIPTNKAFKTGSDKNT